MNPKIQKVDKEIEKTRDKITEFQAKLRDLERQKTEMENTEYVALVRSMNMTPQQLAEFIKGNAPAPASTAPDFKPDDDAAYQPEQEDAEDEE